MLTTQYATGTTPVQIIATDSATAGESMGAVIQNLGAVTVWLGNTAAKATASGGFSLAAGATVSVVVSGGEVAALWAATVTGTAQVAVLLG